MQSNTLITWYNLKFEYSILFDLWIPNSKNKTQIKISRRIDEILDELEKLEHGKNNKSRQG